MEKNFEFEAYKRDHVAFRMNEAMSGYYRLEMYEPNTKTEIHNSVLLIDDPACEDYYDYDLAREQFEQFIEENFNNRDLNVINRAVKEGLWLPDLKNIAPEDIVIECENNILSNEGNIIDEYTHCDIEFTNRGQYYHYIDQDNNDYSSSGEITHLGHETTYYHGEDFSHPLKWFEINEDHHNEYTFVYDRIVDCNANIIALYDYLQ
jgi:hypothetical protein